MELLQEPWAWLLLVVGVALAAWAHVVFWTRRLSLPLEYSSVERLATGDGAFVELRHLASREPAPGMPPVLLVHGIGANHRNHDLHPDYSLARHLRAEGRDVWLLTLRCGRSDRHGAERGKVSFATMAEHDLPVAVRAVRERAASEQVDYVGFSMGGMLLYASLGHALPAAWVRRVAIVGSPARLVSPLSALKLVRPLPRLLTPPLPFRLGARLAAFGVEWVRTPLHRIVYNPDNTPRGLARLAMVDLVADIPSPLAADFKEWVTGDGWVRSQGRRVVEGLGGHRHPALFFAGAADQLAPPEAVRDAFDAWGAVHGDAVDKRMVVLGLAEGAGGDYGHGDLAMGRHVAVDLFAPLGAFLNERP